MNIKEKSILTILFVIPMIVSAHGEEVIYSFFLQLIILTIFTAIIIALKINLKKKMMLTVMLLISTAATLFFTGKMPYNENIIKINLLIFLIPTITFILTFLSLKLKRKKEK